MSALDQIKTIAIVMMENRSFDHLLGWMSLPAYGNRADIDGLRGAIDPATRELTDPAYDNYALNQRWRPFVVSEDKRLATDLPHSRTEVGHQLAFSAEKNAFLMNGFAKSFFDVHADQAGNRPESLMVFPPELLPMTSFLARNFLVCDRWFAPVPADTQPNRLMALSGYTNVDTTTNSPPDQFLLIDWCEKHKVRWHVYHEGFSFISLLRKSTIFHPNFRKFGDLANDVLHDGDSQFPEVILIEPAYDDDPFVLAADDNHPPLPMAPGEAFLLKVYKALTANPVRWANMLVVFTYDEHGGFYDHVPPIAVETSSGGAYPAFATSGPRVPAIVVSPLVKPGSVFHGHLDHTSILRLLAEKFTPGQGYSDSVTLRHQGGTLDSLSAVLEPTAPAATTLEPPQMGTHPAIVHAEPRVPTTANQAAFAAARAAAFESRDSLRAKHPEMLFERRWRRT
jgi:phospholipase C